VPAPPRRPLHRHHRRVALQQREARAGRVAQVGRLHSARHHAPREVLVLERMGELVDHRRPRLDARGTRSREGGRLRLRQHKDGLVRVVVALRLSAHEPRDGVAEIDAVGDDPERGGDAGLQHLRVAGLRWELPLRALVGQHLRLRLHPQRNLPHEAQPPDRRGLSRQLPHDGRHHGHRRHARSLGRDGRRRRPDTGRPPHRREREPELHRVGVYRVGPTAGTTRLSHARRFRRESTRHRACCHPKA